VACDLVSHQLRYKDSELYLMKFRQCMTRGLTLVKMYFIDTLQVTVTEITQKIRSEKVIAAELFNDFFLNKASMNATGDFPDHGGLERGL